MRNSLSNLLRHSIRTTFRVLMHGATWKDMPHAGKIRWRDEVEQFYLSRLTVSDLDWTTVGDDNIFTEGPVQGLSLAIFRLDFSRVARLRLNAARIRCGWTLQQQEKWKHERTQAEAEDDRAFGFDSPDQHRFLGWVPPEPAWEWANDDVVEVVSSDSEEQQHWGDDEQSAASTWGDSSQWSWRPAAAGSAEAARSRPEWTTASTAWTSSERWVAGQSQSESDGRWHCSRSMPVAPPPGLEREEDILRHLDMLQDEHLGLPPAWRSESLRSRSVPAASKYTPLLNQGRFSWDHLANHAEPHVRRTFGRNPVEYAKGQDEAPWKKWSWAEARLQRGRVTCCDDVMGEVLSWMSVRPSLFDKFDSMVAHYDLKKPFGIDMGGLPGLWLQFTIKDRPQPHNTTLDDTRRFGYHGTSMYCISRIFKQDTLVTGMAHLTINSKELFGVYYHNDERAHLCQKTYMHYIGFGGGWYVAPLIVLDTIIWCTKSDGSAAPSVAPRSQKSQKQFITYENQHRLDGMFLHFIHASQVRRMPRDSGICAEPGWVPELELCATDTWEKVQERSLSLCHVPPGI